MNRILIAAGTALLVSTGAGLAADIVPGSDTAIRDRQTAADHAVASGTFGDRAERDTRFGYPARREATGAATATDRADDRAANRTARLPTPAVRGALVPGSDSF